LHDYINHASVTKHRIDRLSCDLSRRRLLSNYRFPLRVESANQISTSLLYSRDTPPLLRVTETVYSIDRFFVKPRSHAPSSIDFSRAPHSLTRPDLR
jgi:hypothetical protein